MLVPVSPVRTGRGTRLLQLVQPVPSNLALNADRVQAVYRDYQELSLGRTGLTHLRDDLDVDASCLPCLAIAIAYVWRGGCRRRLSRFSPKVHQAVAAGDFTPRQAIYSRAGNSVSWPGQPSR